LSQIASKTEEKQKEEMSFVVLLRSQDIWAIKITVFLYKKIVSKQAAKKKEFTS